MLAVREWVWPVGVGHIVLTPPQASCSVLSRRLMPLTTSRARDVCIDHFEPNERGLMPSARKQSPANRRAWYLRPAIVSAFGTIVFDTSPIIASRDSGRSR